MAGLRASTQTPASPAFRSGRPPAETYGVWEIATAASLTISLAYFAISGAILVPLLRHHQVRANRLGTATAAIFFSCAVGHGMHGIHALLPLLGDHSRYLESARAVQWHDAFWDALTAGIAVYYWTMRRTYGALMQGAVLFEDLQQQQRVAALQAREALAEAKAAAEREQAVQDELHRLVLDNLDDAVVTIGRDGRFLSSNPAARHMLGLDGGSTLSICDQRFVVVGLDGTPLATNERPTSVALATGQPQRGIVLGLGGDPATRRWLSVSATPLHQPGDDEPYAVVTTLSDVTTRRAVEQVQREAAESVAEARDAALEAAAAKAAFLATMSHEIRTPMNAVIGMTGLLLDTELDDQQQDFVQTVRSSGDALLTIINDVLDFSKIESGELELEALPFALQECVESALDLVAGAATDKNLDLVCHLDQTCPHRVVGDVNRLRQVLVNLLSNAVKFTSAGEVLVTVRSGATDAGVQLTVAVSDTGIGIPAGAMDRLFRSFSQVDAATTRMYGGTGLGLAISRRLVEAMGGELTVTSEVDVGSTFTFTAVVAADLESPCPEEQQRRVAALAGRRVLMVDDNATNRRILAWQLESWGMVCSAAATPSQALAMLAQDAPYDVAVLDMKMPEMNGLQLASAMRELPGGADLPLMMLTSLGWRPDPDEATLFAAFVTKPAKRAALHRSLLQILAPGAAHSGVPAQPASSDGGIRGELRVLLAEDNAVNQKVAQLMLGKLGHRVDTVGNGREAVEAVKAVPYDVVLMDLQMPVMDGLEATRHIRTDVPQPRQPWIVAMTASVLLSDREACGNAGMDDYLPKPVRRQDLLSVLSARQPRVPIPATPLAR